VVISVVLGFHIEEVENPKCFVSLLTQYNIGRNPSGKFSSSLKSKIYLADWYCVQWIVGIGLEQVFMRVRERHKPNIINTFDLSFAVNFVVKRSDPDLDLKGLLRIRQLLKVPEPRHCVRDSSTFFACKFFRVFNCRSKYEISCVRYPQGCGSGSEFDPDSIESVDPDPDPVGQK
jgi:hypothetical protein